MNKFPVTLRSLAMLAAAAAFAQTKPAFEVAYTIKPAPPMDLAKVAAAMQAGGKVPIGVNVEFLRAEYQYLDLRSLISYAYGVVKPYQIAGPDWMATTRFDILAKMPEGSEKRTRPKCCKRSSKSASRLTTHRASAERPVLALVVGKDGPKLKASAEKPVAIDESTPLKPGESKMDGPNGPVRVKVDIATGDGVRSSTPGCKCKSSYRMNPATLGNSASTSMTTMSGFANMITQLFQQLMGGCRSADALWYDRHPGQLRCTGRSLAGRSHSHG